MYESFLYGLELVKCEHLRPKIWKMICHTGGGQCDEDGAAEYAKLLSAKDPKMDNKIAKDIHRTIPGSQEFSQKPESGTNRLFNVLKAYTALDTEIGYAQGMNFIAVLILSVVEDERDAFWVFVYVLQKMNWRQIFDIQSDRIATVLKKIESAMALEFP